MDKIPYRSDMIFYFFGKRKRFPDETGNSLPRRTVGTFDIVCFSAAFADGAMSLARKNTFVGRPEIRMAYGTLATDAWQGIPQSGSTDAIPTSYVTSAISLLSMSFASHIHTLLRYTMLQFMRHFVHFTVN